MFVFWAFLVIRCMIIANKYATLSPEKIHRYKTERLSKEELDSDLYLASWNL